MNFAAALETLTQELRYGAPQLRLNPGFARAESTGTGLHQVSREISLLRLVSTRNATFTFTQWQLIRDQQKAFSRAIAWSAARFNLMQGGEARYANGMYVSGDFFSVLGVPAAIGRTFTKEDDTAACASPGAVVSYSYPHGAPLDSTPCRPCAKSRT